MAHKSPRRRTGNETYLGELEQMVLMAILQRGEDAYGLAVLRELQERGGRKVSPGVLYATLDRLEGKGVLASRFGSSGSFIC